MSFPAYLTPDDMQAFDTLHLLPLRQMVGLGGGPLIGVGGGGLLDRLSRPERFRILRHGQGWQILARNGLALAEAQALLRRVYGSSLEFGTPHAHTVLDHATGVELTPIMSVCIDSPRAFRQEMQDVLAERSAKPAEITVERDRVVMRAQASLARLIGLEPQVLVSTNGTANVICTLVRYAPAPLRTHGVAGRWKP